MPATEHIINVDSKGRLVFIYSDDLTCLFELGKTNISRASNVEPTEDGQWIADMAPSQGPKLGPYPLRQTALDEEVIWLRNRLENDND